MSYSISEFRASVLELFDAGGPSPRTGAVMDDLEDLRCHYGRLSGAPDFQRGDRIWWIYLRGAVERWLERNEDEAVRASYIRLKSFPENLPDERARWMELRAAVAAVLEQDR